MKRILRGATKAITIFLTVVTIFLVIIVGYNVFSTKVLNNKYSNFFGFTFFKVVSGSMSPTIEKGDIIIVRVSNDFEVGDIVSFYKDNTFITHRIIETNKNNLITQGDANNLEDDPVNRDQVIGKVILSFNEATVWKIIIITIAVVLLIVFMIPIISSTKYNEDEDKTYLLELLRYDQKLKKEILLFLIIFALLMFLIPFALSRNTSEGQIHNLQIENNNELIIKDKD